MLNALVTAVTFVLWWQAAAAAKLQVKGNLNSAGFLDLLATAPGYDARKSVLKESLELYSSGWSIPTIDLGFETGKVKLAKGVTLTLTRLRIKRADAGVPIAYFRKSKGATVVLSNSEHHSLVGAPYQFAMNMLTEPRKVPGKNAGKFPAKGAFEISDIASQVPLTESGLGGYTLHYKNSKMTADRRPPLPSECTLNDKGQAVLELACVLAIGKATQDEVCPMNACINACRETCEEGGSGYVTRKLKPEEVAALQGNAEQQPEESSGTGTQELPKSEL